MKTEAITPLLEFIEFLHSNINTFSQYDSLIDGYGKKYEESKSLDPNRSIKEKLRLEELQKQLDEEWGVLGENIINPITAKAIELKVMDGNSHSSLFSDNMPAVRAFKESFSSSDLQYLDEILQVRDKYVEFRRKGNKYCFMRRFFSLLDDVLCSLFAFFDEDTKGLFKEFTPNNKFQCVGEHRVIEPPNQVKNSRHQPKPVEKDSAGVLKEPKAPSQSDNCVVGYREILLLSALPTGEARTIDLKGEQEAIDEATKNSPSNPYKLIPQPNATPLKLIQSTWRSPAPYIIHFSGHGRKAEYSKEAEVTYRSEDIRDWGGGLAFENEKGELAPVEGHRLEGLFERIPITKRPEIIVLNACHSENQAHKIAKVVKYVMGTDGVLDDKAALAFSRAFYEALCHGQPVEEAFYAGRANADFTRGGHNKAAFMFYKDGKKVSEE